MSADDDKVQIGRRLAAAMALRNTTDECVAKGVEIDRQTIWRYKTGRSTQSFAIMARVAKFLHVRLDYLAYGTGNIEARNRNGKP